MVFARQEQSPTVESRWHILGTQERVSLFESEKGSTIEDKVKQTGRDWLSKELDGPQLHIWICSKHFGKFLNSLD